VLTPLKRASLSKSDCSLPRTHELDLELAGIIGTMSLGEKLKPAEQRIWDGLESAGHVWRNGRDFRIEATIRRAAAISKAAGEDLAYLSSGADGVIAREVLQPVFQELAKRSGLVSSYC
jgi:hypothetical protein